jgi:menaquinone reductase, molybdopterin-binding-like subunit
MDRRDFIKISALTGVAAALDACGNPEHQLIRFIPEEDLIPGIATWKPSICTLCTGGCGMLVRVMEGDAEVVRNGQLGVMKMGLAKKLEGNPNHPINRGKLCPRGQAGLQVTYHPDRVRTPLARSGPRGSGQFKEITWDEAIKQVVAHLSDLAAKKQQSGFAFLTSPLRGQRANIVSNFVNGVKGDRWVQFALLDDPVGRLANLATFGQDAPVTADLGQSKYVISFGADFLGTWNSPVAQSLGYGEMRKGHPGERGKLVQVEPRISQTGASADEWIPCKPGTEGVFALSLAQVILRDKLRPANAAAGSRIDGWAQGLQDYAPEKAEAQTGVPAATATRIAREACANEPAIALIGSGATAHTNSFFSATAVNVLNQLFGSAGKPGGVVFTPAAMPETENAASSEKPESWPFGAFLRQMQSAPDAVTTLFLYNANPVFGLPTAWHLRETLGKIPFIASFGSFIDETSILADLILPDHSPLESWLEDAPRSGSAGMVVSVAPPAVHPLHDTRAMPDVLLEVAHQLGGDAAKRLPWKTYDEAIQAAFATLYKEQGTKAAKDPDDFWSKAQEQGGWWSGEQKPAAVGEGKLPGAPLKNVGPNFDGSSDLYPFHFLPFASQMFYDGSLAHLPWMQEAPDPLSTVMWGTWVELNPATAKSLGVAQGDIVEVASQHGTLQAPALLTPGIAPDVAAMPIGQGHENFTRYASGRGANPMSILAPMTVAETGSLAWAATRVKISKVGEGKMILFGASLREESPDLRHR